jgi:hypothetical protein
VKNKFPGVFVSFIQLQTPIAFEEYMRKNDALEKDPEVSGVIVGKWSNLKSTAQSE